jgi:hypothetical protein
MTKGSIRRKSAAIFKAVISLRKKGFSYSEIKKETGIAKSTINNWLTRAGLTLSKEHLQIQAKKKVENHAIATEASRIIRLERKESDIQNFIGLQKGYFNDPFYNYGIALYEAEGSKGTGCKFSNSDYRLIQTFTKFVEKYFHLSRRADISFSVYIHEARKQDLGKILNFWVDKIGINKNQIHVYWKKNKIVGRKKNSDYVGQFSLRVMGESILGSKMLAISDIILRKFERV